MHIPITVNMIAGACVIGLISAYLAHKREKNPYIWFVLGFFFGIFGIFAIFFFPNKKESPIKKQPVLSIQGPADKFWYYLDSSHESQGPMSHDALTRALREGRVGPSTYVWNEEMSDWKLLKEALK